MSQSDVLESTAPLSRDELVSLVARVHRGATYEESGRAGRALAAQSELPKLVAENLGAGLGQWDFFPEAADVVEFALGYKRPRTPEELWTIARAWASDDAAARPTVMALVGRDVVQHELRRIDVPELRALVDETHASRARELRSKLGLDVRPPPAAKAASAPKAAKAPPKTSMPATPAGTGEIPMRMPKPAFKPPPKPAPPPAPRRFTHPKFGEGVLESESGTGPDAKMTIRFEGGSKTLLAKYVIEL